MNVEVGPHIKYLHFEACINCNAEVDRYGDPVCPYCGNIGRFSLKDTYTAIIKRTLVGRRFWFFPIYNYERIR